MRRNDLIVFEFSDGDPNAEVLIKPITIWEIEKILTECTEIWLRGQSAQVKFEVLLAGVERGSVKAGFLIKFMGDSNTAWDFGAKVGPAIFAVGVATGVFSPKGAEASKEPTQEVSPALVSACGDAMAKLVRVAAGSGAQTVSVSIASCGEARITDENSRDIGLIGAWAKPFNDAQTGEYQGVLRDISGPYSLVRGQGGGNLILYAGQVQLKNGEWLPVILHWASKRPIQDAIGAGQVVVTGQISKADGVLMHPGGLQSNEPIDPALRRASAYLYVASQTVSE